VADDAVSVARFLIKIQAHAVQGRGQTELAGVHQLRCIGTENLRALKLSVLKVGDHEAGKIGGRGGKPAGGSFFNDLKRFWFVLIPRYNQQT